MENRYVVSECAATASAQPAMRSAAECCLTSSVDRQIKTTSAKDASRSRLRARSGGTALVLDGDETDALATTTLRGTLIDMGYDAQTSSVVVRYDAIRVDSEGNATTRRFEARESGVAAESRSVAAAINRAANTVAVRCGRSLRP